jgi:hypothetical protein
MNILRPLFAHEATLKKAQILPVFRPFWAFFGEKTRIFALN